MKKLDSKLFKFKKQKVDDLSKILGGESTATSWNYNNGYENDTADPTTAADVWVIFVGVDRCIKADIVNTGSPIVYN